MTNFISVLTKAALYGILPLAIFAAGIACGRYTAAPCRAPALVEVPYAQKMEPGTVTPIAPVAVKTIKLTRPKIAAKSASTITKAEPVSASVVRPVKLAKAITHEREKPTSAALKRKASDMHGSAAAKLAHTQGNAVTYQSPDRSHTYVRTYSERAAELREAGTG